MLLTRPVLLRTLAVHVHHLVWMHLVLTLNRDLLVVQRQTSFPASGALAGDLFDIRNPLVRVRLLWHVVRNIYLVKGLLVAYRMPHLTELIRFMRYKKQLGYIFKSWKVKEREQTKSATNLKLRAGQLLCGLSPRRAWR